MSSKTYMFQYATPNTVIENTGLITKEEAIDLWKKHKPDFINNLETGQSPDMCIWKDCESDTSYHYLMCFADHKSIVKDNMIYNIREVLADPISEEARR